jgi:hypothetical protein
MLLAVGMTRMMMRRRMTTMMLWPGRSNVGGVEKVEGVEDSPTVWDV